MQAYSVRGMPGLRLLAVAAALGGLAAALPVEAARAQEPPPLSVSSTLPS